ncbi:methyl-accepting chemotaxis protein [Psychromonas sp. SR45-3]|uniref:methyl-accepting chemotaxis protein n=1 Tax=Psychromonas sp. SR45-3 TaxID=2760930 RepID=UPI0015F9107D|nr:methyl-accepting chemotaxis protein [Psychromonas sp. SR45-3]MBB1272953.1 methyl-accepting chemotaxis protein [Psychromonas sp. SR45-3]
MEKLAQRSVFNIAYWSLKTKLTLAFLLLGLLPAMITSSIITMYAVEDVEYKVSQSLEAINQIKKSQIETFFEQRVSDITVLANTIGNLDEQNYDAYFTDYIKQYDYYDLFLVDKQGMIFYTQAKEADYQTNILNGKYASSNLGQLIQQVRNTGSYGIVDFQPYAPSNGDPAAFIAIPIKGSDIILALQLSSDGTNQIMAVRDGMGETGESYLVGEDKLMRSNSFLDPTGRSLMASFAGNVANNGVDTEAVSLALAGEHGVGIIKDYNGNNVLSAYDNIKIDNFNWVILSEIDQAEAFASVYEGIFFAIVLIIICAIIVSLLGLYFSKKIANPIIAASSFATKIAEGDLSNKIEVHAYDEVGALQVALSAMVNNLRSMIGDLADIAMQQGTTADELASVTEQTSASVTEQQRQTEQVVTATTEMGASVREIASTTANASNICEDIQSKSKQGAEHIEETYQALISLGAKTKETAIEMSKLRDDSDQIANMLGVIKQVAEQTNLLALNAAIEAARAGDQGRGFAVVADEVRNLAQSTQKSTKEIEVIIEAIVSGSSAIVETMNDNVIQTDKVQEIAYQANQINADVALSVEGISDMVAQIAAATEQQSVTIDEIAQNIEGINTGTCETEQAVRHIAESSNELSNMANTLNNETKKFRLTAA